MTFVAEIVGPLLVKLAITRAGEVRRGTAVEDEEVVPSVPCPEIAGCVEG
jgi:hypothetical protein